VVHGRVVNAVDDGGVDAAAIRRNVLRDGLHTSHMILLPLRCFKDVRAARERTERYASTGSYVVSWIQVESRSDDRFVPWSPRNESPHSFVGPAFSIRLVIATRKGIFACW